MSTKVDKVKTIELAEKFIRAGKIREAIAEYEKIVERDDQDLGTLNMIGDLHLRLRQEDQAIRAFERVAGGYEKRGQYSQALAIYKKICKISPDNPDFGMKLADLFSLQGHAADARAQYLKSAEHWEKARRSGDAVRVYEKLVKLDREDFGAKQRLAELYHTAGNSDGAIEQLNEMAELRMARGQIAEAEAVLKEALGLNPLYYRTIVNLVDIYRKQEKPVQAIALIEAGVHAGLADPYLLNLLGNLYFEGRQYPKAEQLFERILADHPMSVNARIKLGRLFIRRNKLDEAYALFEPLINNLLKKQKEDKAIGLLGLILVSQRTHLPTLEKLAAIYRVSHDLEKLEVVDRVIFEELRKAGQKERAQEVLEEVLTLKPDDEDMKWERDQLFAPEPKPEPPAAAKPEPRPQPPPVVRPVPKPERPPKPVPEGRPEPKVEVKPEPPPKPVPEVQPEPRPEAKPPTKPEPIPEPWFEVATTPAPEPPAPVKAPPEPARAPTPAPVPPLEPPVAAKPVPPPEAPAPPERRPTPIAEFKPSLPARPRTGPVARPEPPPEAPVEAAPADILAQPLDVTRTEIQDVFRQAELYIQQGLIRNARRILETLRQEYPDHAEIERKIQELNQPRPSLDEEEIRRRVEKAA
ncbi:MAG: tetratricopeptide repeat protein, partial [Candidatus Aminicenantes bacterium]|nr:tetratricopeptide repeat protein [Candidatus Aminicenantes bacterium]